MDDELKEKFKELLHNTAKKIDRSSFQQEPHYTAAFFGKLHNEEIRVPGSDQFIKIECSASNDRGYGSAESKTGIDIGMIFSWEDETGNLFEKALLVQAKNNNNKLDKNLESQCQKMLDITSNYIVFFCPDNQKIPEICRSNTEPPFWKEPLINFDDYLINTVFACKDGDTCSKVINIAKRSDRCLSVKTNAPRPILDLPKKFRKNNKLK